MYRQIIAGGVGVDTLERGRVRRRDRGKTNKTKTSTSKSNQHSSTCRPASKGVGQEVRSEGGCRYKEMDWGIIPQELQTHKE